MEGIEETFGVHQFSDGALRFVALTTLLLQPPRTAPMTIILDEPEIGLHPYAISQLAREIRIASKTSQIIVSTQSPLLLDEFSCNDVITAEYDITRPVYSSATVKKNYKIGCTTILWVSCGRKTYWEGFLYNPHQCSRRRSVRNVFAKGPLNQYFGGMPSIDSRCVLTGRITRSNYEYRGGLSSYQKAKNDIITWLKQDSTSYITTMFDFFRLPDSFPEYQHAMSCQTHLDSVHILEEAMKTDIAPPRFIPYIQLHEFEALLFSDIRVLKYEYLDTESVANIDSLYAATKNIPPENINHGENTAPSKQLLAAADYRKGETSSEWLAAIGIPTIRQKCHHFSSWLDKLEPLNH